MIDIGYWRSS